MKGYLLNTPKYNIFCETDAQRTDSTARALLDIIGTLYHTTPEKIQEAKADPATLADIKARLQYARTESDGVRRRFYNSKNKEFFSCLATDPRLFMGSFQ